QTMKKLKNQRLFVCFDLPNLKVKKYLTTLLNLAWSIFLFILFVGSHFMQIHFVRWALMILHGSLGNITPSAAPAQAKLSHPNLL
ncbi:MAG: hypothetical protein OIF54_02795, partial [Cohaesibacter sp.]|nr:hypothetical protein [Cohaesibacter sp.]